MLLSHLHKVCFTSEAFYVGFNGMPSLCQVYSQGPALKNQSWRGIYAICVLLAEGASPVTYLLTMINTDGAKQSRAAQIRMRIRATGRASSLLLCGTACVNVIKYIHPNLNLAL